MPAVRPVKLYVPPGPVTVVASTRAVGVLVELDGPAGEARIGAAVVRAVAVDVVELLAADPAKLGIGEADGDYFTRIEVDGGGGLAHVEVGIATDGAAVVGVTADDLDIGEVPTGLGQFLNRVAARRQEAAVVLAIVGQVEVVPRRSSCRTQTSRCCRWD